MCGRQIAAENKLHNEFLVSSQMRPTRGQCAVDDPTDYELTFIILKSRFIVEWIVGSALAARRPHAANLIRNRSDHSDALAACV